MSPNFNVMAPHHRKPPCPKPLLHSHLSDSEIMWILTLTHKGETSREIVAQVGHSQSTILWITRTYNYETFESHTLTRLCKWTTTIRQDCILLQSTQAYDDQPFRTIIKILGVKVSKTTLHRQLKEVNLFSRIRHRKPFLKPCHKAARLHWARKYANWTVEDWIKVIWSDESSIVLGWKSRRRCCIRKRDKPFYGDIVMKLWSWKRFQ